MKKRVIEPLKTISADIGVNPKQAKIFFTDAEYQPLSVNKNKIASCKEPISYTKHLQHLPRVGDFILLEDNTKYRVKEVLHLLPCMLFDVQKIYIVLE